LLVVDVHTDPMQQLESTVALLEVHRIVPSHRQDRYVEPERLTIIPFIVLGNKCDDGNCDEDFEIFCGLLEEAWPVLPVSAQTGRNLERLKQQVFRQLGIIRVISKAPGKAPEFGSPFTMKAGGTVGEFARKIHRDFFDNLKSARVWGSAEFDGQLVGREYVLHDGDVVELRT
jgi:hypothetical protein